MSEGSLSAPDAVLEPWACAALRDYLAGGGDPAAAVRLLSDGYRGEAHIASLLASWLVSAAGRSARDVSALVADAAERAVLDAFDPRAADALMQRSAAPPSWLEAMVRADRWRPLLCALARRHPSCAMLSFAVARIADAGHTAELVPLGAGAALRFGVFNRVLRDAVAGIVAGDGAEDPAPLCALCAASAHTYLYALLALRALAPQTPAAERLSQELFLAASARDPAAAAQLRTLVRAEDLPPDALPLLRALGSAVDSGQLPPGDVADLCAAYESDRPPPLALLRDFRVLDVLVRQLFDPLQPTVGDAHARRKYVFLLARAATWPPDDEKDVAEAITAVVQLCPRSAPLHTLRTLLAQAAGYVRHPVVAMGVVRWAERNLLDPDFYLVASNAQITALHMQLLREAATHHVMHHRAILAILAGCFALRLPSDLLHLQLELKRQAVELLVDLLLAGCVKPVLDAVSGWCAAREMDPSLVRAFLQALLGAIDPPYTPEFASWMLVLLALPAVGDALAGSGQTLLLALAFLRQCGSLVPELSAEARQALQQLLLGWGSK